MATLDEIFASMPDAPAGGTHELLIIDPDTRQIYVPEIESVFGVITDGNAEKKYFQCPRYVGKGIDLAGCKLRIAYQNASGTEEGLDGYLVTDLTESGGFVYFSWELSEKVCLFQGAVQFAVCAMQGSTVVWNTTIATGTVLEGLTYNGEIVQTEMQDVIAQLITLVEAQSAAVEAVGAEQVQAVQNAAKAAQEATVAEVEAKKQSVLADIPDDYTAMAAQVDALTRSTAGAIVCQAEGATIQVHDASDHPLHGLRIFGRSTQDGTPSPEVPADIVGVENPAVTVGGKNLLPIGTATFDVTTTFFLDAAIPAGEYKLTCNIASNDTDGDVSSIVFLKNGQTVLFLPLKRGTVNADIKLKESVDRVQLCAAYNNAQGAGDSATWENVQLEVGTESTEYDTYKALKALSITHPLHGIPVVSGGNYTDADGQQWICDEVDLGRGMYVQRVGKITLDNSRTYYYNTGTKGKEFFYTADDNNVKAWETRMLCTHFPIIGGSVGMESDYWTQFSSSGGVRFRHKELTTLDELAVWLLKNTVTMCYVLETPEETAITELELAAFAALHSVKPTTTILNDSGAHMAVEYVADTKLYIDSKLAELVAAMNA